MTRAVLFLALLLSSCQSSQYQPPGADIPWTWQSVRVAR